MSTERLTNFFNGLTPGADNTLGGGTTGPTVNSLYQLWLNDGNTGTEQDFLDTLENGDLVQFTVPDLATGPPLMAYFGSDLQGNGWYVNAGGAWILFANVSPIVVPQPAVPDFIILNDPNILLEDALVNQITLPEALSIVDGISITDLNDSFGVTPLTIRRFKPADSFAGEYQQSSDIVLSNSDLYVEIIGVNADLYNTQILSSGRNIQGWEVISVAGTDPLEDGGRYLVDNVASLILPPPSEIKQGITITDLGNRFDTLQNLTISASAGNGFIGDHMLVGDTVDDQNLILSKNGELVVIVGAGDYYEVIYNKEKEDNFFFDFTITGRFLMSGAGNWATFPLAGGPNNGAWNRQVGSNQFPNVATRELGRLMKAGTKIRRITLIARPNQPTIQDVDFILSLRTGDYDNGIATNGPLDVNVFVDERSLPLNGTEIKRFEWVFDPAIEITQDSMLNAAARPANRFSGQRSMESSILVEVETGGIISPVIGAVQNLDVDIQYTTFFGGFDATVTLTNNTGSPVSDWILSVFDANYSITSISNSSFVPTQDFGTGTSGFDFSPDISNAPIPDGGSVSFVFGGNTGEPAVNNPTDGGSIGVII